MYLKKGNYDCAIPLIERAKNLAPKDKQCPPLTTISLIFGWSFNGPDIVAQQHLCQILYADGRMTKTVEILNIIRTLDEEVQGSKATAEWITDFTQKCASRLERAGDEALGSEKHDDAITQYSTALSLNPPSPAGLFVKRSRARAAKELWEDALQDAVEVCIVFFWRSTWRFMERNGTMKQSQLSTLCCTLSSSLMTLQLRNCVRTTCLHLR
ncbi:hypothetical protein PISMIDRAFT_190214 [Pisolithus microcarpus 441]|uniref:Uncharacterized protein n=1 Tax=Pisolithus microcarpus 441 TaxID=765257 RepID=A0A0C9Z7Q8_9AGAM|nr:hypothetical protein PISMIDRAFT_190214 [Pisolithus microcarpus 441]